jgi:hypothetical protein
VASKAGAVEKPAQPQAGESLTARVSVTRAGRLLNLDYRLTDANGKRVTRRAGPPPEFTVSQNGREIGSGSFAYG